MRAMTLAETLVCLFLSMGILGSVVHFSSGVAQAHVETRIGRLQKMNLDRSVFQIQEVVTRLEPSFWQAFPAIQDPIHGDVRWGSGWSFSNSCDAFSSGPCLTLYDVEPFDSQHLLELESHIYPAWIRCAYEVSSVVSGEVVILMACDADNSYSFLAQYLDEVFWFVAESNSFWHLPEMNPDDYEWILLGKLSPTHFYLDSADRRGKSLYQEGLYYEEGWHDRRSRSSFQYLQNMSLVTGDLPHLAVQGDSSYERYVYFSP